MDNNKEFQVSVADVIAEDIVTGTRLFTSRTLISSNIKEAVSNKEVKGGYGAKLQYEFDYDKKITSDLEDCQFKETYLALANGQEIKTKLQDFFIWDEKQIVTGGKVTLNETPVGKVVVENEDEYYELTPSDKTVTVSFPEGSEVICSYRYNTSTETFDIDGENFGRTIKLTYISRIFKKTGLYKIMQIEIPRFKIEGKFDIDLKDDGVSSSKISGKALDYNGKYAIVRVKRVDGTQVPIQNLVCTEQDIALKTGETATLDFIGVRGGMYSNVPVLNSDITFTCDKISVATVDTSGIVTYKGVGTATITAKLKSNDKVFDIIQVTCS